MLKKLVLGTLCILMLCCQEEPRTTFALLDSSVSGIDFNNNLEYSEKINAYTYRNFYNGAGVAVGDINNDGLLDIYFAGNQVDNKLFLNKGDLSFDDITIKAGVACENVWTTGVSMADVNGDGWLDIYVCKSGPQGGENRYNELFINNGDLTFSERAKEFGLDDEGLSTHAAFFDYDKDNDLDIYLLNNSGRSIGLYDLREGQRNIRDSLGSNKLYRNDGNTFTDVSEEAGIYGSSIGYGLGVTVADLNLDGWQDIYVSNDFFEKDYLYFNNGDGTFTEDLEGVINEISIGSMGADVADLNNDGFPEIYVTEMLPERWDRIKTKSIFEDWDKYQANLSNGYYHQFSRNVLQLNNGYRSGDSLNNIHFSEIARFTDMNATDWSWGALVFDYNNDGNKDVFVANGVGKDLTDQDYINFYANNNVAVAKARKDSTLLTSLMDQIPAEPLSNYLFHNDGNLTFDNRAESLGLNQKTFSNGASYGDLDNDGDLDLIINNINAPASIYVNQTSDRNESNYLQLVLKGKGENTAAFGTQITAYSGNEIYYVEQSPVKGYMSSMDAKIHLGLGNNTQIDSLVIMWPDRSMTKSYTIKTNQLLIVQQSDALTTNSSYNKIDVNKTFEPKSTLEQYKHQENDFVDFNRDRLLFEMLSNEGPIGKVADVNNDGFVDLFIGGAKDNAGRLYLQSSDGSFKLTNEDVFEADARSEDSDAIFSDFDKDGDLDLFVASGGNEFSFGSGDLKDRLYVNKGDGVFEKSKTHFKSGERRESTGFVHTLDFDQDGDDDLLVGTRLIAFAYGVPGSAYLYENDGSGNFTDVTKSNAPELEKLGLMTGVAVEDFDKDGDIDFIISGEWMPVTFFENENGKFSKATEKFGLSNTEGLWNTIECADLNGDGYPDLIVGNHGLNSRLKASEKEPMTMYINDFDQNGSIEQIVCINREGLSYPIVLLQDLTKQIPSLRKKFTTFDLYKDKSITEVFTPQQLERALKLEVKSLETTVFINNAKNGFEKISLPMEAQFSKVYSVIAGDFNNDKIVDLVLGGNQTKAKPELGIYNATYGLFFKGTGKGNYTNVKSHESGIFVRGEIRDILNLKIGQTESLIFLRNSDQLKTYTFESDNE